MIFSKRSKLADEAIEWCGKNNAPITQPVNILTAIDALGYEISKKPPPLQVREGKWYKRRDGVEVGPMKPVVPSDSFYKWNSGTCFWSDSGKYYDSTIDDDWDLIAEVPGPASDAVPDIIKENIDVFTPRMQRQIRRDVHREPASAPKWYANATPEQREALDVGSLGRVPPEVDEAEKKDICDLVDLISKHCCGDQEEFRAAVAALHEILFSPPTQLASLDEVFPATATEPAPPAVDDYSICSAHQTKVEGCPLCEPRVEPAYRAFESAEDSDLEDAAMCGASVGGMAVDLGVRTVQSDPLKVGDTIQMKHYPTTSGFRVWKIGGVHLGALGHEGTYRLNPLDVTENEAVRVPCIMLEALIEAGLVWKV